MEPEGSLPRSQELSTAPYPEPDRSNPYHHILLLYDPLINHNRSFFVLKYEFYAIWMWVYTFYLAA
jgi:hypothetical protein